MHCLACPYRCSPSRFPRAHGRGTKTIPPYFLAFAPGLTSGVLCWLASRVPVVFFHGCWNLLSSHGEPGTPGYPRSGSWVREAHTAGYPLAGVGEGATRAPLIGSIFDITYHLESVMASERWYMKDTVVRTLLSPTPHPAITHETTD